MENNQEKAKKILFSRTDIGDEKLPNGITKINGGGYRIDIDVVDAEELKQWGDLRNNEEHQFQKELRDKLFPEVEKVCEEFVNHISQTGGCNRFNIKVFFSRMAAYGYNLARVDFKNENK